MAGGAREAPARERTEQCEEDLDLAEQVDWWTRIQDLPPDQQRNELFANVRKSKKSSRQRRGRRGGKSGK